MTLLAHLDDAHAPHIYAGAVNLSAFPAAHSGGKSAAVA